MPNGCQRIIENHAWANIAHHRTHSLASRRRVAMILASPTAPFGVAFRAPVKSLVGIVQQSLALLANPTSLISREVVFAAIYSHHLTYDFLLFRNFSHGANLPSFRVTDNTRMPENASDILDLNVCFPVEKSVIRSHSPLCRSK